MKESRYQQFEIVVDSNPTAFRDKLNATLISLAKKRPVTKTDISGDTFKAIIEYEEIEYIPETAEDELEARGLCFVCSQCPRFEPSLNNDGTVRRSSKHGSCFLNRHQSKDARVCEWFAAEYLKGNINPIEEVE